MGGRPVVFGNSNDLLLALLSSEAAPGLEAAPGIPGA
jgi:hypothetical protein